MWGKLLQTCLLSSVTDMVYRTERWWWMHSLCWFPAVYSLRANFLVWILKVKKTLNLRKNLFCIILTSDSHLLFCAQRVHLKSRRVEVNMFTAFNFRVFACLFFRDDKFSLKFPLRPKSGFWWNSQAWEGISCIYSAALCLKMCNIWKLLHLKWAHWAERYFPFFKSFFSNCSIQRMSVHHYRNEDICLLLHFERSSGFEWQIFMRFQLTAFSTFPVRFHGLHSKSRLSRWFLNYLFNRNSALVSCSYFWKTIF